MPKYTKVLMVDDDKMLLDMYKERLELAGFDVETSSNGEECLAKIHQVKPDIVLLDIMMPKVNGYDTLASIKSDPATKDTPVIILSALVRDINKSRAIEAGADDYIIKSEVMPVDVIKKVNNVLEKYHKDVVAAPKDEPSAPPNPPEPPLVNPSPPVNRGQSPVGTVPLPPPPPPPPQEIQFEPSKGSDAPPKKRSPLTLFFLILIVLLILGSDIFFYLRFVAQK